MNFFDEPSWKRFWYVINPYVWNKASDKLRFPIWLRSAIIRDHIKNQRRDDEHSR